MQQPQRAETLSGGQPHERCEQHDHVDVVRGGAGQDHLGHAVGLAVALFHQVQHFGYDDRRRHGSQDSPQDGRFDP